jgi:hypothetical protein
MLLYLGPSCSDHSFTAKLDDAEINTRIRRVLALRAHRNYGPSLIPLGEGVARKLDDSHGTK